MKPVYGFAEVGGLEKFVFGTQIGPRGTIADILARKAARKGVRDLMDTGDKRSEAFHPALAKLAFNAMIAKLAAMDKEAPFQSEAQRRKFYAMESRGEISKKTLNEWESATPDGKLPERVEKKEAASNRWIANRAFMGLVHRVPKAPVTKTFTAGLGGQLTALGRVSAHPEFAQSKVVRREIKDVIQDIKLHYKKGEDDSSETEKLAILAAAGKAGLFAAKSFLLPTTAAQTAAGVGMWSADAAMRGMKKVPASKQISQLAAETLIEMTKQSMEKAAKLMSAVPMKPSASKEPSSFKGDWLKRSTTGAQKLNVAASTQEGRQMAGPSVTEQVGGASAGSHIQRNF
jgi:hypothetical protein